MERSSRRTVADPWFLIPIALVSFTALAYPIYVIRPFRHQGPRELAAALEVIQIRPPIELVCAICALLGLFWYWRVQPLVSRRRLAAAGAFLVCTFAVLSRVSAPIEPTMLMCPAFGIAKAGKSLTIRRRRSSKT